MAYRIDRYNNTLLTVVEDGTIDQTTDLKFIGRNYAGYGEIQNENFLFLLENFAGAAQPARPVSGQIWYDSANSKLKFYDGAQWRTTGGAEIGGTQPSGLTVGDFWWDSSANQLYAFTGNNFILIGPQNAGEGITQMQSIEVLDTGGVRRPIMTAVVNNGLNDEVIYIVSAREFDLGSSNPIPGFTRIKKGITLVHTNANGVTVTPPGQPSSDPNHWFWGTASNAARLGGTLAQDFITRTDLQFEDVVEFSDEGITIGEAQELQFLVEGQIDGILQNVAGSNSTIRFRVTDGASNLTEILKVDINGLTPADDNRFDIGSSSFRWRKIYAVDFDGEASRATTLRVGTAFRNASVSAAPNTVAVRDSSGNLSATLFQGTATQARYADLAEVYKPDVEYPVGTAVAVGGTHEITAAELSDIAIGVISDKPAYLMNSEADGQAVGLKGRVPVRVTGPVSKGQAVYAWRNGVCSTMETKALIGVALESNGDNQEKLVECVLKV